MISHRRLDILLQHWTVEHFVIRTPGATPLEGYAVRRDGWVVSETLETYRLRKPRRYIPRLPGLPEDVRTLMRRGRP